MTSPLEVHVDDFIYQGPREEKYARWVLLHMRLPAVNQIDFHTFMKDHKLFCSYKGTRYRVTGASRMGDVWLAKDFAREHGYDKRVDLAACSGWAPEP